jgi:hypothetical protein
MERALSNALERLISAGNGELPLRQSGLLVRLSAQLGFLSPFLGERFPSSCWFDQARISTADFSY